EVRAGEPARVLELIRIHLDLAAGVGRDEADHELARERPVLAADVADVLHVHADLFLHLARHGALELFAVVDEAGDERVAIGRPARLPREQHAVTVAHGGLARERDHPALGLAQRAEPERLAGSAQAGRPRARRQAKALAVRLHDQLLVLDDEPVTAPIRRLRALLGGDERRADAVAV